MIEHQNGGKILKNSSLFFFSSSDFPVCHNERPEVYFRENVSLECIVKFSGIRHPLVDWR